MIGQLISRTINTSVLQYRIVSFFSNGSYDEQYNERIISLRDLNDFDIFLKQNGDNLNVNNYSYAAKSLSKIIFDNKRRITFEDRQIVKSYVERVTSQQFGDISIRDFMSFVNLNRTIQNQNLTSHWTKTYRRFLTDKTSQFHGDIEREQSISKLCYYYQQFTTLGSYKQSRQIVGRLRQLIRSQNAQQELKFNSVMLLISGMKTKKQLEKNQIILFKEILGRIRQNKIVEQLSISQIVKLGCLINELPQFNTSFLGQQNKVIRNISQNILDNIDDLDQRSIMTILNSKKNFNSIHREIYQIIFNKIFDSIETNGESDFSLAFTLRLIAGISSKMNLGNNKQNQEKFKHIVKGCITSEPRSANQQILRIVKNNFLNSDVLNQLVSILKEVPSFRPYMELVYELSLAKKVDIRPLVTPIDNTDIQKFYGNVLIMNMQLFHNLSQKQQQYVQTLNALKEKFQKIYVISKQFLNLLMRIRNNDHLLNTINRVYDGKFYQKLPQPMTTQQGYRYRDAWMAFNCFSLNSADFAELYYNKIQSIVDADMMKGILRQASQNNSLHNLIFLCNVYESKNGVQMTNSSINRFLDSFSNLIISSNLQNSINRNYWRLITRRVQMLQKEKNTPFIIVNILRKIITSQASNHKNTQFYKEFIIKLIEKTQFLPQQLQKLTFEEAINLDLLTHDMLANISQLTLSRMSFYYKTVIKMIKDPFENILPSLSLKKDNIKFYLRSRNQEVRKDLIENSDKALQIIKQMDLKQCQSTLLNYRWRLESNGLKFVKALLATMTKGRISTQHIRSYEIYEVLRKNNCQSLEQAKKFFEKILNEYTNSFHYQPYAIEDCMQLLTASADMGCDNTAFMSKCIEKFRNESSFGLNKSLFLLCAQLGYKFNEKDIKFISQRRFFTRISTNKNGRFQNCLRLFILLQSQLKNPEQSFKAIAEEFPKLNEKNVEVKMNPLYINYLSQKYPQIKQLNNFKDSQRPLARKNQTTSNKTISHLMSSIQKVLQTKIVEKQIQGNFVYLIKDFAILVSTASGKTGQSQLQGKLLSQKLNIPAENLIFLNLKRRNIKILLNQNSSKFDKLLTQQQKKAILENTSSKKTETNKNSQQVEDEQNDIQNDNQSEESEDILQDGKDQKVKVK